MGSGLMIDKTYSQSTFTGQIHCCAPVTPFSEKGDLMLDAYAELLRYNLDVAQVDALLVAGDNGEGYGLDDDELRLVTETAAKTIDGRIHWHVQVSRTSNRHSIARAEIAAAAGAPGICLGQPYIHDCSPDKIVERFEVVAKAVPLPMMVYNLPLISHFNITPAVLRSICDVAPVDVVKDASPEMEHITFMLAEMGDRFPILYGQRHSLIAALLLGSGGFVGTGPELFGRRCRDFINIHSMTPAERLDLQHRYWLLNSAVLHDLGTPPAGLKAAFNLLGLPGGFPRDHVSPLTAHEVSQLRDVLIRVGVLEDAVLAKTA